MSHMRTRGENACENGGLLHQFCLNVTQLHAGDMVGCVMPQSLAGRALQLSLYRTYTLAKAFVQTLNCNENATRRGGRARDDVDRLNP